MNTADHTKEELIRFVDQANKKLWLATGIPDFDPVQLVDEAFAIANEIDYAFGKAQCSLNSVSNAFIVKHDIQLAFSLLENALRLFIQCENSKWIANTHCITGIINNSKGDSDAALYHSLRGSDYYDNNPDDEEDGTMSYYVIGTVYKDLKKLDEAERCFLKGVHRKDKHKANWEGRVYSALASVYAETARYDEALETAFKAVTNLQKDSNGGVISRAYTDIGIIYKKKKNYPIALEYMEKGLQIRINNKLKAFMISSHMEIASLLVETGNAGRAEEELKAAEIIALEANLIPRLVKIYEEFLTLHKKANDFTKALYYSEKLLTLNSEVNKKETESKIYHLRESLFKEKEDEIERLKNVELKKAYEIIGQKNKDITDSIRYAKRIQESILTSENYIHKNLNRLRKN